MVDLREARAADGPFLVEMLAIAANWRPAARHRSVEELLGDPEFAHYISGWPEPRDCGIVAEVDAPVGAAWYRFLPGADRGYGYVADDIPELTIGVRDSHRGRGIGEALLRRLIAMAGANKLRALSLSVEDDNSATRLYERLGFVVVSQADGATTMLFHVNPPAAFRS